MDEVGPIRAYGKGVKAMGNAPAKDSGELSAVPQQKTYRCREPGCGRNILPSNVDAHMGWHLRKDLEAVASLDQRDLPDPDTAGIAVLGGLTR